MCAQRCGANILTRNKSNTFHYLHPRICIKVFFPTSLHGVSRALINISVKIRSLVITIYHYPNPVLMLYRIFTGLYKMPRLLLLYYILLKPSPISRQASPASSIESLGGRFPCGLDATIFSGALNFKPSTGVSLVCKYY
jgi:hypothetical protein